MADIVTKQKLENADTDVDNLGKAVNEKGVVNPRYGEAYPTLPSAIQIVLESGGFEPFETETLLKASVPVLEKKAAYSLDTHKVFLWESGVWKDTGLSAIDQAKTFTNNLRTDVKNVINKSSSGNKLFSFLDASKRIVAYFDRDSEFYLSRLEGSVQTEVLQLKDNILSISDKAFDQGSRNKLLSFLDKNKKVIGYFDKNSELHLTGMTDSVQSKLSGDSLNTDRINNKILNVMSMSGAIQGKMLDLYSIGRPIAPVPLEQMPLKYTVDNSIVNLRINQPASNTAINTPYEREGEGRAVHPNIFQVKDTFCGYKYILGLTPYYMSIDKFENPVVYGSNDLINFDMLTELTLADVPVKSGNSTSQYNSDIFFAYDYHTGELLCGWREVKGGYGTALYVRRTKDLKNWSAPEVLWQSSMTDMLLSPCIVYNPQTEMYDLFCIEAMSTSTNNPIRKVSTKYLQNPEWENSHLIYPNIVGFTPWHIDVRYVGDKLMAIMHEYHEVKGTLWVGISSDHGETWTWGEQSLLQGEYHKPYKASLCPIYISDTQIKLCYVWTSANFMADKSLGLMLYIQQSETIQISKI